MPKLIMIGSGRLGGALAVALERVGHEVLCTFVHSPHTESRTRAARTINIPLYPITDLHLHTELVESADAVLIAVPDKAVSETAQTLLREGAYRTGQVCLHTAGALSSSVLSPLQQVGVAVASMHPLQTFADPLLGAERFTGITFSLEGEPMAVAFAHGLVKDLGGKPVVISAASRPRYHAAAVLASNAVVALASVASDLLGLPDALQTILPLLKGAVENLESQGLPNALTGPVDRNDQSTLLSHLEALQDNPTALHVYCALGKATVQVARRKGSLTRTDEQKLLRLFQGTATDT